MLDARLNLPWHLLKWAFGLVPIIAGLDKFTQLLTDWTQYLNPLVTSVLPMSATTFMHLVGVIEIAAGILVLSKFTRVGAWVVTVWLVCIALNLIFMGRFLDVAVRDLVLAFGAFTLARLTAVRETSTAALRGRVPRSTRQHVPA